MENDNDDTEDLFKCLTDEEQENLAMYLERLIEAWQKDDHIDRRHMGRHRAEDFRGPHCPEDERLDPGLRHHHGPEHHRREYCDR